MNRLLWALILCLVSGYSNAGAAYGIGTTSCGAYLAARAHDKTEELVYLGFVTGYLSGVNFESTTGNADIIKNTDMQGVSYWLDNYCHANPTEMFSNAVGHFVVERELADK